MCMWPFVVNSLLNEVVRVLTKPGAGGTLSHPLQEQ